MAVKIGSAYQASPSMCEGDELWLNNCLGRTSDKLYISELQPGSVAV